MQSQENLNAKFRFRTSQTVVAFVLAIVVLELAGIWNELHQIRKEQVKNALYSLPEYRRSAIRPSVAKNLESTVTVNGSVAITDTEEPIKVEVDNQPVEVEIER